METRPRAKRAPPPPPESKTILIGQARLADEGGGVWGTGRFPTISKKKGARGGNMVSPVNASDMRAFLTRGRRGARGFSGRAAGRRVRGPPRSRHRARARGCVPSRKAHRPGSDSRFRGRTGRRRRLDPGARARSSSRQAPRRERAPRPRASAEPPALRRKVRVHDERMSFDASQASSDGCTEPLTRIADDLDSARHDDLVVGHHEHASDLRSRLDHVPEHGHGGAGTNRDRQSPFGVAAIRDHDCRHASQSRCVLGHYLVLSATCSAGR